MAKSKRIPKKAASPKKTPSKSAKATDKPVDPGVLHLINSFKLGEELQEDIQRCVVVCYTEKKQLQKFDSWEAANAFAEQHKKDKPGHKTDIICKQNDPA